MDTLCLGLIYFDNSLRSIKTSLGCFLNSREAGFVVRSIRVFQIFVGSLLSRVNIVQRRVSNAVQSCNR